MSVPDIERANEDNARLVKEKLETEKKLADLSAAQSEVNELRSGKEALEKRADALSAELQEAKAQASASNASAAELEAARNQVQALETRLNEVQARAGTEGAAAESAAARVQLLESELNQAKSAQTELQAKVELTEVCAFALHLLELLSYHRLVTDQGKGTNRCSAQRAGNSAN